MNGWYKLVRQIVSWVLQRYFRKIQVEGLEHIPNSGPVLFTVNHQNAFLDALLVATSSPRELHFLARADVFKSSWARGFFESLNMMPIYRWRDGRAGLEANHQIFAKSHHLLDKQQALLMFPEANHHQKRLLLPLSKGFTRISSGISESGLQIIPVGLNYTHHRNLGGSVSIYYGAPIAAGPQSEALILRAQVSQAMQALITHIPDNQDYQWKQDYLDQNPWQYLDPDKCNLEIKQLSEPTKLTTIKPAWGRKLSVGVSSLLNFPPLIINHLILTKIGDPVFNSSIKVISGLLLFPLYYLSLWVVAWNYLDLTTSFLMVVVAWSSMVWRKYSLA